MPYFNTSSRADLSFGHRSTHIGKHSPYHAFQYYVHLKYDKDAAKVIPDLVFLRNEITEDVPPLVKSVSLPDIHAETDVMNEYNRKRISQHKLKFDPITVTFHDTTYGQTLKIWHYYYQYYFRDGMRKLNSESIAKAPINGMGKNISDVNKSLGHFGYNLTNVGDYRNLFTELVIYQMQGGWARKVTLFNPRISDFNHHDLAYEKNDIVEITYTFEYEYAEYDLAVKVSDVPELKKFFDTGRPVDISPSTVPAPPGPFKDPDPRKSDLGLGVALGLLGSNQATAGLLGAAMGAIGTVGSIGAIYDTLKTDLPFGLGKNLPENPIPSVRSFEVKTGRADTAYKDVVRVAKDVFSGLGNL